MIKFIHERIIGAESLALNLAQGISNRCLIERRYLEEWGNKLTRESN